MQELVKGLTTLEVVKEGLSWDTGANENWRSAEDPRVGMDYLAAHDHATLLGEPYPNIATRPSPTLKSVLWA